MSRLNLVVDSVDNAATYHINSMEERKTKTPKAWITSVLNKDKSTLPRNVWVGGTGYTEAKVASVLRDFLQPDSKTLLKGAADTLLVLIPPNASGNAEISFFGGICVELAEQIPYHHPSQLKLVQLLHYLARSPKFMDKHLLSSNEEVRESHQLLWECIGDVSGPNSENPIEWVNLNAFKANLFATGVWGSTPGKSLEAMRSAFDTAKPAEPWERDANVMAAAQWIIWFGQNLFKLIICNSYEDDAPDDGDGWWLGHGLTDSSAMEPRSIERWRSWKDGFKAVEDNKEAGDDCRKLAARAAGLMGSIERSMLSLNP